MVSLKDIAARCKVSTATVSKALNGQSDVSDKTREKVQRAAREMGYFPNAAARALKTNRSYNLGVLFRDEANSGLTHAYFAGVLNGFKVQAEKMGYDITFINTRADHQKMSYYEHCRYRNFDGVIIVCVDFSDPDVVELMQGEIPIVTIDYVNQNCTAVSSDNVQGIEDLVRYIYSRGHRKIAYIHGQEKSYVTRERLAGFYRTVQELELEIPVGYVREARYLETCEAAEQTRELLSLPEPPTCIIYPDDMAYIGGRNVIQQMGLRIPEDISVAGYDGNQLSQLLEPGLTTIMQDTEAIGARAAKCLIERIESPKTALIEQIYMAGTLCEGGSVAKIGR